MSNSTALASLTATYTDSEGEGDSNEEEEEENNGTVSMSPRSQNDKSSTSSSPRLPTVRVTTKVANLVSYNDTIASDEENDDAADEHSIPPHEVILVTDTNTEKTDRPEITDDDEDGLIPPDPPGHCSVDLQDKIAKYYERMRNEQLDMNAFIEKRKDFRNPSIYEKLLQFCAIDELGTNYPPSVYDPLKWSKESYYEELAKVQKAEIEKRERDRKNKELMLGLGKTKSQIEEEAARKRKSKWDQPGNAKRVGLVQAPVLSTTTKSTVISAFGSLPKKRP